MTRQIDKRVEKPTAYIMVFIGIIMLAWAVYPLSQGMFAKSLAFAVGGLITLLTGIAIFNRIEREKFRVMCIK